MPVKIGKLSGNRYRVSTPNAIHAKSTTHAKAEAQARLLRGVEHGWRPTGHNKTTHENGMEVHVHNDRVLGAGPKAQTTVVTPRPILVERVAPSKHRPG